ncbi:acetolactate synthase small subunit [Desulfovibrio mangrovi]|uniref:acetolactate synthase small subunit n=1 Tax=Desulfovibrio mangrovi TaxID=2976983 RepID=UPI002247962C|nr:acetolactate synthase small subunit [Desulfovibrio mangrovi]UZP68355.1 acetolactate synthase small subunit [Desulfovibrio mangrovi]
MPNQIARTVLDVTVSNHPGVMSHVCGLFSRRAFNVEAILCLPVNGGEVSRIWLLVNEDDRLEQMIRQMRKLQDVHDVRVSSEHTAVFSQLGTVMAQ